MIGSDFDRFGATIEDYPMVVQYKGLADTEHRRLNRVILTVKGMNQSIYPAVVESDTMFYLPCAAYTL